jgi:hypothetical protein
MKVPWYPIISSYLYGYWTPGPDGTRVEVVLVDNCTKEWDVFITRNREVCACAIAAGIGKRMSYNECRAIGAGVANQIDLVQ